MRQLTELQDLVIAGALLLLGIAGFLVAGARGRRKDQKSVGQFSNRQGEKERGSMIT